MGVKESRPSSRKGQETRTIVQEKSLGLHKTRRIDISTTPQEISFAQRMTELILKNSGANQIRFTFAGQPQNQYFELDPTETLPPIKIEDNTKLSVWTQSGASKLNCILRG